LISLCSPFCGLFVWAVHNCVLLASFILYIIPLLLYPSEDRYLKGLTPSKLLVDAGERAKQKAIDKILELWNIDSLEEIWPGHVSRKALGQSALAHLKAIARKVSLPVARTLLAAECGINMVSFRYLQTIAQNLSDGSSHGTPAPPSKAKSFPGASEGMAGSSKSKSTAKASESNSLGSAKRKDLEAGTLLSKVSPSIT
jgi:hypothetical protein